MAIITFWGNNREHVGKTLSVVAVATQMAIEHNKKILILSTSFNDDTLKNCFFEDDKKTKKNLGIFGANSNNIALQNGIEGLDRIVRSNRVTPDIITDYTKIVFKNRLEVLLGYNGEDRQVYTQISENYQKVIELADKYYRERIYAESNKPDYTEEELRLQKERAKKLDDYVEKLRREEQEELKSKHP